MLTTLFCVTLISDNKLAQILCEICPSTAFLNGTTAQQNQLVADCIAAKTSLEGTVTGSTHENHARLWHHFTKYLRTIGISNDIFLDSSQDLNETRSSEHLPWLSGKDNSWGGIRPYFARGRRRHRVSGKSHPRSDHGMHLQALHK